ncbi:Guanine nucleotide-binding protein [Phytophthora cinnamomi]|uniref:Guanine nucleotide-binding protein n=1 Tax=Phytophthora cinnamomi TaxID=4785 RepID=UPI0035598E30|nr:Guanine nucleotide-binding protein [Phytophthora cinnamomi]
MERPLDLSRDAAAADYHYWAEVDVQHVKEKVDTNESLMFDQWLTKIHDKYDNEHLNHFEHNLEVWRELWRVTERATHVVVVADVRNPLLHIPASVYDLVTKELKKPMVVVLNKVDLIPTSVVQLWKRYLATRFPLRSRSASHPARMLFTAITMSVLVESAQQELEVGDASAIKGAVDILVACGIDAVEAQQLAEELNASMTEQESLQVQFDAVQEKKRQEVRLQSALAAMSTDPAVAGSAAAIGQANTPKVTIGLIGHPNVGHTKRLQSIMIAPEICICDCPGLVFPFAGVPKYLQELSGLYPYSQIREPYSAVRFLAEHVVLERILDLKPRTQLFDGLEEELEWTPWTLCEAYAEKRGYRTDRRGRPDHQRAGSELVRDTVDGILPLFFLPPDYTGKDITPASIASTASRRKRLRLVHEESDADADNDEEESSGKEDEDNSSAAQPANDKSAPVNAFSLLDSDSSDEDSDED